MKKLLQNSILFFFVIFFYLNSFSIEANQLKINREKCRISTEEGVSHKWFFNGKELEGMDSPVILAMSEGWYSVESCMEDGTIKSDQVFFSVRADAPKIYIIGDSTASNYASDLYPRTGWGQILQAFLNTEDFAVINRALSGRSSRSYYTDAAGWPTVLRDINAGDYLFIQFGHNDSKTDDRYTDPYTTYQEYLSIYIDSARNRGAYPVLLTSIHRNKWVDTLINDSHGDYPPAMRALAAEKNCPLIDLHAKSRTLFESFGQDYTTTKIFMNLAAGIWVNYPSGNEDNTHFQENGAFEICKLIIEDFTLQDSITELAALKVGAVETGRVIVNPNPELSGTVIGIGVYAIGDGITLKATPKNGFVFKNWYEADTLFSEDATLNFTLNDTARVFEVNFEKAYKVTLGQGINSYGILEGSGYYGAGSEVTITAIPKEGYEFVNWAKDDVVISTNPVYSFTMGEENVSYLATLKEIEISSVSGDFNSDELSIYPNPVYDLLYLRSQNVINRIEIITPEGKIIYSKNKPTIETSISLEGLEYKGILILKLSTQEGSSILKIVKQ